MRKDWFAIFKSKATIRADVIRILLSAVSLLCTHYAYNMCSKLSLLSVFLPLNVCVCVCAYVCVFVCACMCVCVCVCVCV